MKGFIETLKNIWSIEDLRRKILYTLGLLFIYRLGSFVVLPGIVATELSNLSQTGGKGILGIFNMFAGGAFTRASVFALGIMPYISASIVIQLLTIAVPYFQRLQKDGESGRRKVNQITRYLTVFITLLQASAYVQYLNVTLKEAIVVDPWLFWISTTVILTAGTVFVMWLGEKIQDRGIGNGTSIIIMSGIIATLPASLFTEVSMKLKEQGWGLLLLIVEMLILIGVVFATIALVQATRKVPVNYAKRIVGNKQFGGVRQYLPLKVNISGVMPIIFAQAFLFIPGIVQQIFPGSESSALAMLSDYTSWAYSLLMFTLVVLFTYFYTAIVVNPVQIADDLKKNNGFIPGVKPGLETSEYIDNVTSRITLPGAVFLGLIAIMPAIAGRVGVNSQFAVFYGGTSLLIMVSVILDTLQQIESHLLMRHYDGLTKTGTRIKGRNFTSVEG